MPSAPARPGEVGVKADHSLVARGDRRSEAVEHPKPAPSPPSARPVSLWRLALNLVIGLYLLGVIGWFGAIELGSSSTGWAAFLRECFPCIFVPLPVLIVPALLLRAAAATLGLSSMAALLVLMYGAQFAPRQPPYAFGPEVRVLSFNMGAARRIEQPDAVVRLVRATDPDLVCLVEAPRNADISVGARLSATHPFQTRSDEIFVFSRYPLSDAYSQIVDAGVHDSLQVSVNIGNRLLDLTVVHLLRVDQYRGVRGGLIPLARVAKSFSTDSRDAAIGQLLMQTGSARGPQILVGDFNMTPTSDAHRKVTEQFRDTFEEVGRGFGHTYPTTLTSLGFGISLPLLRIDYIFHSDQLVGRSAWAGPDGGSDHLPVLADLAFR